MLVVMCPQITGNVVEVVSDPLACTSLTEDLTGVIAIVRRGDCTFLEKVVNAEAVGAIAVIVINTVDVAADMSGGTSPVVNIPVIRIKLSDGEALLASIDAAAGSPVTVQFWKDGRSYGSGLDTSIVSHEWGHYLHYRLEDCGTIACSQMSEGWADFLALHLLLQDGDDLDGTFGIGTFVKQDKYFGIRRVPYSVDFLKDPLTFKHVSDSVPFVFDPSIPVKPSGSNSQVHNAGEVWATALWEVCEDCKWNRISCGDGMMDVFFVRISQAYVALHKSNPSRPFEEVKRAMADYIVSGMLLTPTDATFVEQRDALLLAAKSVNQNDVLVMASAFARRGLGYCMHISVEFQLFRCFISLFDFHFWYRRLCYCTN